MWSRGFDSCNSWKLPWLNYKDFLQGGKTKAFNSSREAVLMRFPSCCCIFVVIWHALTRLSLIISFAAVFGLFCCSVWFLLLQCLICVAVFGFVHFTDETEQQRCMIEQNNTDLNGKRIVCRAARQQQYQSAGSYGQNLPPVSSTML